MSNYVRDPLKVRASKAKYKKSAKGKHGVLEVNRRYRKRKRLEDLAQRDSQKSTYLMHMQGTYFYKIGVAWDPDKRVKQVQNGNPLPVRLIRTCNYNIERSLHKKYAKVACMGEWFRFEEDQLTEVLVDFHLASLIAK